MSKINFQICLWGKKYMCIYTVYIVPQCLIPYIAMYLIKRHVDLKGLKKDLAETEKFTIINYTSDKSNAVNLSQTSEPTKSKYRVVGGHLFNTKTWNQILKLRFLLQEKTAKFKKPWSICRIPLKYYQVQRISNNLIPSSPNINFHQQSVGTSPR